MKLTLVADNTTSPNWGCRATSLALTRLLASKHEIVAAIPRKLLAMPLTTSRLLSESVHRHVLRYSRILDRHLPGQSLAGRTAALIGTHVPVTHDIEANADALQDLYGHSVKATQIIDRINVADAIVVNGEGEMIFSTPARDNLLHTLTIMALAIRLGKKVFYANGMVSKPPVGDLSLETVEASRKVLEKCVVALRDPHSVAVAHELMPSVSTRWFADALFTWKDALPFACDDYSYTDLRTALEGSGITPPQALRRPYLVLSGSSLAAKSPDRAIDRYSALATALKTLGLEILLIPTCAGDRFLVDVARRTGLDILPVETPILAGATILAQARLMVSGRWHPSILASLGGVPALMLGSNSHKTETLLSMMQRPFSEFSALPDDEQIEQIVALARADLAAGGDLRKHVSTQASLAAESARELAYFVG